MDRRSFLRSILAAGVAPYVVTTAGVLMPGKGIVRPELGISRVSMPDVVEGPQNMIYRLVVDHPLVTSDIASEQTRVWFKLDSDGLYRPITHPGVIVPNGAERVAHRRRTAETLSTATVVDTFLSEGI